jgi:hypothetical protein
MNAQETTLAVVWTYSTNTPGMYGWGTRSRKVATVEEGLELVKEKFQGSTYEAELVQITPGPKGRRQILASRKRKQEIVIKA